MTYNSSDVKMAALASFILRTGSGLFVSSPACVLNSVRFASKKSSGSSRNLGGKSPGRRFGYKKCDGNFVHLGNTLATQRQLRYHPGAHVGLGRNNTLFALADGHVRYTKEVYIPRPRNPEVYNVIINLPRGTVLYKTFINVVPVKQENKFRLVELV
ncbi:large ribosomal subunit protein bL27m [Austrofundulus limnaeus]|uniref:Large ribosomal subunit protein bL27m n=1 Tax=Austrofundulus limnaeus TaxID=52670 RepID=A0A2I4D2Z9_AUSLI|nr:PREDICTED: 39S ribosomal protein L27, mitochondrial [Austrofundulus limnaeus]